MNLSRFLVFTTLHKFLSRKSASIRLNSNSKTSRCHFSYVGESCETLCKCNKHSECAGLNKLDICLNCQNNTMGSQCQFCKPFFVGDPRNGNSCVSFKYKPLSSKYFILKIIVLLLLTFSFEYFLTPIELCIPIFCFRFPARTTATVTRTSVSRATRKKRHSSPEMRRTPVATFSMLNLLTQSSPASNGARPVTPFASTAATWPSEKLAIGNDANYTISIISKTI